MIRERRVVYFVSTVYILWSPLELDSHNNAKSFFSKDGSPCPAAFASVTNGLKLLQICNNA